MFNHINDKLHERNLNIPSDLLVDLSEKYTEDTAIVLLRLKECKNDSCKDFYEREESNGELVILIVRHNYPITIFYRRLNQPLTPESLKVKNVVHYENYFNKIIKGE